MKSTIIIANGDIPSKRDINFLISSGISTIIAADGGANSCFKLGLSPDYIIGDFDSIKSKVICHFKKKSQFIKINRQNDTDVEKALKYAIKKKFKKAYLFGGTGDRLDHTICNLGIILKYFSKIQIILIHRKSILVPYNSSTKLKTVPGETISLYAFNPKTTITSSGLKYELKKSKLTFGLKESTSNEAISNKVNLQISGGLIFIIRDFNLLKKNDLIFQS